MPASWEYSPRTTMMLLYFEMMVYSESNCAKVYFFTLFYSKYYLQIWSSAWELGSWHNWVEGTCCHLKNYLENWWLGEELLQKKTAVAKAMFRKMYKAKTFDHPDCDNNTFFVSEEGMVFIVYSTKMMEGGPFLLFSIKRMLKMRVWHHLGLLY